MRVRTRREGREERDGNRDGTSFPYFYFCPECETGLLYAQASSWREIFSCNDKDERKQVRALVCICAEKGVKHYSTDNPFGYAQGRHGRLSPHVLGMGRLRRDFAGLSFRLDD
jgi:hypothetical protein